MKRLLSLALALLMICSMCIFTVSCGETNEKMLYTEDATLGTGAKTITFNVEHKDGTKIKFTIKTDRSLLSDALLEHNLIEGENGEFGIYVKKVNGITQDYDIDKSYWALYIDGEYALTGAYSTEITDGGEYTFKVSY